MTGKIYLLLGSTFLMGAFAGAYLYVSVFAPAYESDIATSEAVDEDTVVIEGQMYGGCLRSGACASFKLIENGSYSYLAAPDAEVENGKLPKDVNEEIFDAVGTDTFFNATDEISKDFCSSFADGSDFTYEVTLGEETYTLDTCKTTFAYDDELQASFLNVWNFMQNPTTTYPVLIEEGVGGFFKDRFQSGGQ